MISLQKTVFAGEALQTLVAMQSEYTSIAQIKECAKYFSDSHDNEYQAIAIFNDGTMLHITTDEDGGLQYNNEWESDFVVFISKVMASYKGMDLCFEFDTLLDLFDNIVIDFDDNKKALFDIVLCDYSYSYDLSTLVNYVAENVNIFEGSRADYAQELIGDCYDTNSMGNLANYIDYDAFGRDIELEGGIQEISYNVYWTNPNDIY